LRNAVRLSEVEREKRENCVQESYALA